MRRLYLSFFPVSLFRLALGSFVSRDAEEGMDASCLSGLGLEFIHMLERGTAHSDGDKMGSRRDACGREMCARGGPMMMGGGLSVMADRV